MVTVEDQAVRPPGRRAGQCVIQVLHDMEGQRQKAICNRADILD